ncbi:hypothetical protein DRP05_07400 [Archaeoglobales archaeon]|nr:MAG: hypothetical protein DRP05_07400 [Archaeoglobales archaeon]
MVYAKKSPPEKIVKKVLYNRSRDVGSINSPLRIDYLEKKGYKAKHQIRLSTNLCYSNLILLKKSLDRQILI